MDQGYLERIDYSYRDGAGHATEHGWRKVVCRLIAKALTASCKTPPAGVSNGPDKLNNEKSH
jgi:hypothetical protein